MSDVLTVASRINRNLKGLSLADQKAVIAFIQKSLDQREQDKAAEEVAAAVEGSTAADAGLS